MRIIAGKYKGRTLFEFKGYDIRPTSDRARESLFDILQLKVPGCAFLDLFCGTGAVGIEALSRGAKKAVLNDVSRESVKIAKQNKRILRRLSLRRKNHSHCERKRRKNYAFALYFR